MKNRELLFNELLKMRNSNVSLDEMIVKATHYHLNYYETVNLLHEITKLSVQEISDNLLKDNHWQKLKEKTDENEMNAGLNEAITICLTPAHNQKHPSPEALRMRPIFK